MKRILKITAGVIPVLLIAALAGPQPDYPPLEGVIPTVDWPLASLDSLIEVREAKVPKLKPDNQARVIWADSVRQTPYSVVYLHGFSASPMEGDPVHREFAARYSCNLYLPRLPQHGIDNPESFREITPKEWIDAAREALAVGRLLGKRVILMSCSTGSTLSLYLAAEYPDRVDALIMYSPNIAIADPMAKILTYPWGLQAARMIVGGYRHIEAFKGKEAENYWTTTYRTEGVVALQALLDETMQPENLEEVRQPFFLGYYYKNEGEKDEVVSIEAMQSFFTRASTPPDQKQIQAFPDVGTHMMPSGLFSKDLPAVREATYRFAEEVLRLVPRSS